MFAVVLFLVLGCTQEPTFLDRFTALECTVLEADFTADELLAAVRSFEGAEEPATVEVGFNHCNSDWECLDHGHIKAPSEQFSLENSLPIVFSIGLEHAQVEGPVEDFFDPYGDLNLAPYEGVAFSTWSPSFPMEARFNFLLSEYGCEEECGWCALL